jgi:hypothetical protein
MSIFNLRGLMMKIDLMPGGWTYSATYGRVAVRGERVPTSTACYLAIVEMVSRARMIQEGVAA